MPTTTIEGLIKSLVSLKLDLIPIKPGSKQPIESNWNIPEKRQTRAIASRFAKASGIKLGDMISVTAEDFTKNHANIGVLNEPSGIITLDCDSPHASAALQSAADALGGDTTTLYQGAAWTSAKGMKVMYRRPPKAPASRAVFKVWNGAGADVIFELRGTGQDVLPPSWREDAGIRLAWLDGLPEKIPAMPAWLAKLYMQMLAGHGDALSAMYDALNVDPAVRGRSRAHSLDAYPAHCTGFPSERGWVNANYSVAELLEQYGYVKVGNRWRPGDAVTAAGIIAPRRGRDENWLCEHEGDPLAGVFDAFRLLVELEFEGDAAACAESIRLEQRRGLGGNERGDAQQNDADDPKHNAHRSVREQPDQDTDRTQRGQGNQQDLPDDDHSTQPERPAGDHGKNSPPDNQIDEPRDEGPEINSHGSSAATAAPVKFGATVTEKKPRAKPKHKPVGLANDFFDHEADPVVPVITGLLDLTPGVHLLSGMPKCGKSTLATAIAMTAASGHEVSGFRIDAAVPVLYLALDESVKNDLQPRMLAYQKGKHLDVQRLIKNINIIDEPGALIDWANAHSVDTDKPLPFEWTGEDEAGMSEEQLGDYSSIVRARFNTITRALYHYIDRHGVRVAVVDVVTRLRLRAERFEAVYDRDMMDFLSLNEIGLRTGCAIVGLHHMNKDAASRNSSNDVHSLAKVSGSNAIAGAVQSVVSMSRITGRGIDQETIFEVEPRGRKIILDHIARDTMGLDPTVISLTATEVGTRRPMLEWVKVGSPDLMQNIDERQWIIDWLYEQNESDYFNTNAIVAAGVAAGVIASRGRDMFRQVLNKMRKSFLLESGRGPAGGWRLSSACRKAMDERAKDRKY